MKGGFFIAGVLCLLFLALPGALAEIFMGKLGQVYNVGDMLEANFSVKKTYDSYGFFEVEIDCGGSPILFYKNTLVVKANEEKNVSGIVWPIGDVEGKCFLLADYDGDFAKSATFSVTRGIRIDAVANAREFAPSGELFLRGSAYLESGKAVDGFAEIVLRKDGFVYGENTSVVGGNFSFSYTFSRDASPGEYNLTISVYTKDIKNKVTNRDSLSMTLFMKAIATRVVIRVNETITPPAVMNASFFVYDQAGGEMGVPVIVKLYSPERRVFFGNVSQYLAYALEGNALPGTWRIEATYSSAGSSALLYVLEHPAVDVLYRNGIFIIKNVGNVPYHGSLPIVARNESEEVFEEAQVDLGVGKEMNYTLNVSSGNYSVSFNDREFEDVAITGRVVALADGKRAWWAYALLIALVVGGLGYVMYARRTEGDAGQHAGKPLGSLVHAQPCVVCIPAALQHQDYVEDVIKRHGGEFGAFQQFYFGIFKEGNTGVRAVRAGIELGEHFSVGIHSEGNADLARSIAMRLVGVYGKQVLLSEGVYQQVKHLSLPLQRIKTVSVQGRVFGVYGLLRPGKF